MKTYHYIIQLLVSACIFWGSLAQAQQNLHEYPIDEIVVIGYTIQDPFTIVCTPIGLMITCTGYFGGNNTSLSMGTRSDFVSIYPESGGGGVPMQIVDPSKVDDPCGQIIANENICLLNVVRIKEAAHKDCGSAKKVSASTGASIGVASIDGSVTVDPFTTCTNNANVTHEANMQECSTIKVVHSIHYKCPIE